MFSLRPRWCLLSWEHTVIVSDCEVGFDRGLRRQTERETLAHGWLVRISGTDHLNPLRHQTDMRTHTHTHRTLVTALKYFSITVWFSHIIFCWILSSMQVCDKVKKHSKALNVRTPHFTPHWVHLTFSWLYEIMDLNGLLMYSKARKKHLQDGISLCA